MTGERITRANLDERCANLNRRMAHHGSKYRYAIQGRNGYIGLDRYCGASLVSTVTCGTKREIADFLHAGMVVLDDVEIGRYMDNDGNYIEGSAGI